MDFLNNFGLFFAMCSAACALKLGYTVSRKESYVKFMQQSTHLLGVLCVTGCSRSLLEDLLNVLSRVRGYSDHKDFVRVFLNNFGLFFAMCSAACALELG